jgi:hypothetical protein
MFRFPYLSDFLAWELIAVADAMDDGSYWEEDNPFYTDNYTIDG